jgi:hypothetical protein
LRTSAASAGRFVQRASASASASASSFFPAMSCERTERPFNENHSPRQTALIFDVPMGDRFAMPEILFRRIRFDGCSLGDAIFDESRIHQHCATP